MSLHEQYRPRALADLLGQPRAVAALTRIAERDGFTGDAFWIVGPSGTGKTSLAWIIARRFASEIDIIELDGDACNVESVRNAADTMRYSTLSGGFRAWIVNEAQAMTGRAVQAWLTTLDPLPARTIVIFTTTDDSESLFGTYDGPFRSRCKTLALTNQGLADLFAARARQVAIAEGLDGQPLASYKRLAQKCKNNLRRMYNEIESGAMLAP